MTILYITPTDPRETAYGGQQRTHVIWQGLKTIPGATVKTVVPVPHKSLERADEVVGVYRLCFEKRWSLGWLLQRFLKRIIPFWDCSWGYDWKALHRRFADTDIIVTRYIANAAAFKVWKLAPFCLDADDIHTAEYDLMTHETGDLFRRRIIRYILGRYQFGVYAHAKRIWIPAAEHLPLLAGYPATVLPNIPCGEKPDFSNECGDADKLLFVGLMNSTPNVDAMEWFLSAFWCDLLKRFPHLTIRIVGQSLPTAVRVRWSRYSGVELLGYVPNIDVLYRESLALITPMRIGMGSCIKVVEALNYGRCVLSTQQGLRGIPEEFRNERNGIFTFSDRESLFAAINRLRTDLRGAFQRNAVDYVRVRHSQQVVDNILCREVQGYSGVCRIDNHVR